MEECFILNYKFDEQRLLIKGNALRGKEEVCVCKISINKDMDTWTISSWYTKDGYKHRGIGKNTLMFVLEKMYKQFGRPKNIEYIWNGVHEYVIEWLENNFNAKCKCDLAVMKYQCGDSWDSHIYKLDTEKFIKYFKLEDISIE